MQTHIKTIKLSATKSFDGGVLYILGNYFLKLIRLIVYLLIWQTLSQQGVNLGVFTMNELFIYSIVAAAFSEQLNVVTPATTAFWEGSIISRYTRPLPVLLQLSVETIGTWLPKLIAFALPILAFASLKLNLTNFIVNNGAVFALSLLLSVSLGFAIDYAFVSLVIKLKTAHYTAYSIRMALITFMSGAVIPFELMPFNFGRVLEILPFGSLASAPLLILTGNANMPRLILLQLSWNLILWPIAIHLFKSSQERMVSYGG